MRHLLTSSALACALLLPSVLPAQSGTVAIRAGRILTGDTTIIDGTLLIENGRITAVGGADLEVPYESIMHEYPDATLFAGFAEAHTNSGMDRANEGVPIAPFLNVADSINPVATFFEDELRAGTVAMGVLPGNETVIGGRGRVVMPAGMTIDQMTLTGDLGMKIVISPKRGWSRSAQIAELREAFEGLDHRLRLLGQKLVDEGTRNDILAKHDAAPDRKPDDADRWDSQAGAVRFGDDFAGKDLISEEDLSDQDRGLLAIRNGDERVWLACATASDVVHGKKWVSDMGLLEQTVFVVTAAAWKAAAELSGAGLGVVLQGALWHVERNPVTYKEVETFAPKVFHDAGVTFALGSNGQLLGPNLQGCQAATCVREGVPRSVALDAVTRVPAQMWGLEGQIGTLTAGADGTFVLLDGDPLDVSSRVLEVWMRGIRTYDRTTDERLQRLTEGR
ncbi:MAG: hypothetical protein HOM34_03770 [Planctomycetes bacterium]|nr:hypothetical protein [Planctomycetota bacterium]